MEQYRRSRTNTTDFEGVFDAVFFQASIELDKASNSVYGSERGIHAQVQGAIQGFAGECEIPNDRSNSDQHDHTNRRDASEYRYIGMVEYVMGVTGKESNAR